MWKSTKRKQIEGLGHFKIPTVSWLLVSGFVMAGCRYWHYWRRFDDCVQDWDGHHHMIIC